MHITAHKARSLSLALLLFCHISTFTVHNTTIKFVSTPALLRCIRSHTGATLLAGVLQILSLLLLLSAVVLMVVMVVMAFQGPESKCLSHKTTDRQTRCLLQSCSVSHERHPHRTQTKLRHRAHCALQFNRRYVCQLHKTRTQYNAK
jgi:hypothetical protein